MSLHNLWMTMAHTRASAFKVCIVLVIVLIIVAGRCYQQHLQEILVHFQSSLMKSDKSSGKVSNVQDARPETQTEDTQWRMKELDRLSKIVQRRLFHIQNPKNCDKVKKVFCEFEVTNLGYGAAIQDVMFCLLVAYATNRTLVFDSSRHFEYSSRGLESMFLPLSTNCTSIKKEIPTLTNDLQDVENIKVIKVPRVHYMAKLPLYLPLSIPEDIGYDLIHAHQNPSIWWIGQFLMFATRYNPDLKQFMEASIQSLGLRHPIVGIGVRGTDKFGDADIHELDEYMIYAHKWFEYYEKRNHPVQRRVFLATDDMRFITEAKMRYPNYTFITNVQAASVAGNMKTRYTKYGLRGALLDIELLSRCDYYVCTLSSNFAKIVYYLMHLRYWDAPSRIKTLDVEFTFNLRYLRSPTLYEQHMQTRLKDNTRRIKVFRNSSKFSQATIVSLDNEQLLVPMPTYPEVPVE